jgi:hypothetical protein
MITKSCPVGKFMPSRSFRESISEKGLNELMKRLVVLAVSLLLSSFALAEGNQLRLTPIKSNTHHHVKHHAHRAAKHHAKHRHQHSI